MAALTDNAKRALRIIFTDFTAHYNAYSLKDKLGMSDVGTLKLLRSLHQKDLLLSERMGNAIFYKIKTENGYAKKLLELILMENLHLSNFLKGWLKDLNACSPPAKAIILFGSILHKEKEAKDADIGFILKNAEDYQKIKEKVRQLEKASSIPIHPLYLTVKEFAEQLRKKDKPLVEIVKTGIFVKGVELIVEVLSDAQE